MFYEIFYNDHHKLSNSVIERTCGYNLSKLIIVIKKSVFKIICKW